mgnify:CR=1 FL=1
MVCLILYLVMGNEKFSIKQVIKMEQLEHNYKISIIIRMH